MYFNNKHLYSHGVMYRLFRYMTVTLSVFTVIIVDLFYKFGLLIQRYNDVKLV